MGEENKSSSAYFLINNETGEMMELGKTDSILDVKVEEATGEKNECVGFCDIETSQTGELTLDVKLRTITKKRFIKLLMGMKYQRNEANIMHEEYIKKYKSRTVIGLVLFEMDYRVESKFEFKIGGIEDANCESR